MFAITTPRLFFQKVKMDLARLREDIADPSRAINCILSAYHLHEWVWAHWLKARTPTSLDGQTIRKKDDFKRYLDTRCPHFRLIQELANGTKHCSPVHSTDRVSGWGRGPYGIGPFGAPYLLIDLGDTFVAPERYLVASTVLEAVVEFWNGFFQAHAAIP